MMAVNASTPNIPRLLMVKVPPARSAGRNFPLARAFREIAALFGDFVQCSPCRYSDHRSDHDSVIDRHRQTDVDCGILANALVRSNWRSSRMLRRTRATNATSRSLWVNFTPCVFSIR